MTDLTQIGESIATVAGRVGPSVVGLGRGWGLGPGRRIRGAIEHTAALPRGSSGGPLVDTEGRVLGLNSLRMEGGLILAVPVTQSARERIGLLARGEAAAPHPLGVAVAPPWVARRMRRAVGLPERAGILVRAVEDDSPAARAGLERGDLLVAAAGRALGGAGALYAALDAVPPAGGELALTVVRGTEERDVPVRLGGEREAA